MSRRVEILASVALATAASGLALRLLTGDGGGQGESASSPGLRQGVYAVELAGRTIEVDASGSAGAASFEKAPSALSARGTAPFVLVATGAATRGVRNAAEACGARVLGVVAPYGIVVEADAEALRRIGRSGGFLAAEELRPGDKISPPLAERMAEAPAGSVDIAVLPLAAADAPGIASFMASCGSPPRRAGRKGLGIVKASVPAGLVGRIAERGDVRWIELSAPMRLLNDVAVLPGLMNVTPVWDVPGLTGKGQTVTISDTGIDTGDPQTVMEDFSGRISLVRTMPGCFEYDVHGHGTHVAGSLAGDGALSGGAFKGVAYEASINFLNVLSLDGESLYEFDDCGDLFQPDRALSPSYISSASWGGEAWSYYDSYCKEVDLWMWEHPENLAVFAAGNNDRKYRSINSPAGAKNVLAVGATESLRPTHEYGTWADNASAIAALSSVGPMRDGRIKPDVCAPGTLILSTRSSVMEGTSLGWGEYAANSNYTYCGGTSMATPLVAGAAALVRQWLVEKRGYTNEPPTAALIRAVLSGGAYDMSKDAGADCGGTAPNRLQGWGRVDAGESVQPSNRCVRLADRIPFSQDSVYTVRVTTTNTAPLEVQLVWTDYPGDVSAAKSLVNDLDLVVSNELQSAVWTGNGVEGGDTVNPQESVRIASAPADTYVISVKGRSVLYDSTEGGAAALYVRGAFPEGDQEDEREYVELTVAVEGESAGGVYPSAGVHRVTKGVTLRLEADDVAISTNSFGTVTAVRQVAGWNGTGSVPQTGSSRSVMVTLDDDSSITWRWKSVRNILLRSYPMISSLGPFYWPEYVESWPEEGAMIEMTVPDSIPGGGESLDMTGLGLTYVNEEGRDVALTVQRLGRIEVAAADEDSGEPQTNSLGHMATEFTVTMDGGKDVLYMFYDVAHTNLAASLPAWWYNRYVAGDPNAGEVRFTSVSRDSIEWTGGYGSTLLLERAGSLEPADGWIAVHTNSPMPVLTNSWTIPVEFSTNSFFRMSTP